MKRFLFILFIVSAGVLSFLYFGSYSDGIRSGMIVKVSKKGMLFKTYEGQLNLQTFGATRGTPISETFEFSVEGSETEVINMLEQASLTGERVSLHYVERYITIPWRGDTKYFITKVERVNQ
ncbi:MAG: hypothetical protein L0Y35_05495 [Flammeovirgaceae bacterium]|nr:hypothetical protein [Flammeovirgaceae bacterium]